MTTYNSQTHPKDILTTLFASAARVAVLRLFVVDPLRPYYQRQIEAATGLAIRAVQRELERLTSISLLYRRVEGNRTYYQVDEQFRLYPELRSMLLKTASAYERLRAALARESAVRLAFLNTTDDRVLVVAAGNDRPALDTPEPYELEVMTGTEFTRCLAGDPGRLAPFLSGGADILGRRGDVIWRRIEAAGFEVAKGEGVP